MSVQFFAEPYNFPPLSLAQDPLFFSSMSMVERFKVKITRPKKEVKLQLVKNIRLPRIPKVVMDAIGVLPPCTTVLDQVVGSGFEKLALSVGAFHRACFQESPLILRASMLHLLRSLATCLEFALAKDAYDESIEQETRFEFPLIRGLRAQHQHYSSILGEWDETTELGMEPLDPTTLALYWLFDNLICSEHSNLHTIIKKMESDESDAILAKMMLAGGRQAIAIVQALFSKCFTNVSKLMGIDEIPSFKGMWPEVEMLEALEVEEESKSNIELASKKAASGARLGSGAGVPKKVQSSRSTLSAANDSLYHHLDLLANKPVMVRTCGIALLQDCKDHLITVDIMLRELMSTQDSLILPVYVETILDSLRSNRP